MSRTYAQLEDTKTVIVRDLAATQTQLENAKAVFERLSDALTTMQTTYASWAQEVNALATANPNDTAVQSLKAERDRLVAEFSSTKAEADALDTAVKAV